MPRSSPRPKEEKTFSRLPPSGYNDTNFAAPNLDHPLPSVRVGFRKPSQSIVAGPDRNDCARFPLWV
jgi:hypothetical protein